jgi:hypothetical protein
MKMKHWMFLAAFLAFTASAERMGAQATPPAPQDAPPVIPAGDVPAPPVAKPPTKAELKKADDKARKDKAAAAKTAAADKKVAEKAAKARAADEKKAPPLTAGPAIAKEKNVNVRGQAAINSEIVTHLKRGDLVSVIEEVTLTKPKTDEPSRWAKISLPAGSVVWVSTLFINPDTKEVVPKRLNLRSGPGENYSILGRIERGTVVTEVEKKGSWIKIEAPTNSYAFVAAHLLSTDPADLGPALAKANPPAPAVPPPPPVETVLATPPPEPAPAEPFITPPPTTPPPVVVPPPPPPAEALVPATPPAPPEEEPLIKRIVTREGIVKGSASIQAPSYFVLRSLDNNKTINYLFATSIDLVLKDYHLQRVIVTGEEVLDERWPNTPVINVDSIQFVP